MAGNRFAKQIKGMSNTLQLTVVEFFQKCNSLPRNVALRCLSTVNENQACGALPTFCTSPQCGSDEEEPVPIVVFCYFPS